MFWLNDTSQIRVHIESFFVNLNLELLLFKLAHRRGFFSTKNFEFVYFGTIFGNCLFEICNRLLVSECKLISFFLAHWNGKFGRIHFRHDDCALEDLGLDRRNTFLALIKDTLVIPQHGFH